MWPCLWWFPLRGGEQSPQQMCELGAEMMVEDPDTLSEHTGVGVVLNLLKNRFSSEENSRFPCTPEAGLLHLFHPIPHLLCTVMSHLASILSLWLFFASLSFLFNSFWTVWSSSWSLVMKALFFLLRRSLISLLIHGLLFGEQLTYVDATMLSSQKVM